jgi:tetratricopeptide (TPR) repeat protein
VDAVVEGSVERVGNQVRITAQLIEAPIDRHLWAKKYERELRNALQLQDEVAQAIAREIQVKLTPQEQTRLASSRTVNPEAYDDYLKGRYFYYRWTAETNRKAHEYFQQAINKDPNYAPAWALWADTLKALELPPQESAKRAREALQKALQLDDSLAEVHTAIAVAKFNYEWDWAGGARELRRSIELNPNYAEAHHRYSHYLMAQGRVEDSLRESQRALDSDPLNLAMMAHLAWHYLFAREYDQAIAQARRTLDRDPNYVAAREFLADAEEQKGEHAAALVDYEKALTLPGGKEPDWFALPRLGYAFALAGKKAEVLNIIDQLRGKGSMGFHGLAIVYLGLGDKERSLAFLKKAVDEHAVSFFDPINKEPIFDSLHSDARFADLLRRIGLPP